MNRQDINKKILARSESYMENAEKRELTDEERARAKEFFKNKPEWMK